MSMQIDFFWCGGGVDQGHPFSVGNGGEERKFSTLFQNGGGQPKFENFPLNYKMQHFSWKCGMWVGRHFVDTGGRFDPSTLFVWIQITVSNFVLSGQSGWVYFP